MIKIHKFRDCYIGENTQDSSAGLLRIPAFNNEAENTAIFMRLNESYCDFLPISGDDFPAGYYSPHCLFTNWDDYPELHQAKIMAWDAGKMADAESCWVRNLIIDFCDSRKDCNA